MNFSERQARIDKLNNEVYGSKFFVDKELPYYFLLIRDVVYKPGTNGDPTPPLMVKAFLPEDFSYSQQASYNTPLADFTSGLSNGYVGSIASIYGYKVLSPYQTVQIWDGSDIPTFSMSIHFENTEGTSSYINNLAKDLLKLVTPSFNEQLGIINSPAPSINITGMLENFVKSGKLIQEVVSLGAQGASAVMEALPSSVKSTVTKAANAVTREMTAVNESSNTPYTYSGTTSQERSGGKGREGEDGYVTSGNISIILGNYITFPSVVINNINLRFVHAMSPTGFPLGLDVDISWVPLFMPTQQDLDQIIGNGLAMSVEKGKNQNQPVWV